MGLANVKTSFDFDAYMAWEDTQTERHEYWDGEVFAMSGASDAHNTIIVNLVTGINQHLKKTPCRVFVNDMKLRVVTANHSFYPDLMVACDDRDKQDSARLFKQFPKLIVEVQSDSTTSVDRGRKFESYRQIPTLEEYVLIEQDRKYVEIYSKNEKGQWWLREAENEQFSLESIALNLHFAEIYENVEFIT